MRTLTTISHSTSAGLSALALCLYGIAAGAAPRGALTSGETEAPAAALPANEANSSSGPELPIDLEHAIGLTLEQGLGTQLAAEDSEQAGARADAARAELLPHLAVAASQYRRTSNLEAMGFDFPGAPAFVGPFDSFDARVQLSQTVFDAAAWRGMKGAQAGEAAAAARERLARESAAAAVARLYIHAVAAQQAVASAKANLELANSLLRLARDQHQAGVATGVDVARATTDVARRREELIAAESMASEARVQLKRTMGVEQRRTLVLTDKLAFGKAAPPSLTDALNYALQHRAEIEVAQKAVAQFDYEHSATEAQRLPTVDFVADYGSSGITPRDERATYAFGIEVSVPLFSGGAQGAAEHIAASRERQARLRLVDAKREITQDVRLALVRLQASAARVDAARQARDLAEREFQLARDRFEHGLSDTVGVVSADAALAVTRNDAIAAVAAYQSARVDLAAALGRAESFHL